jgi:hypothetical protein
MMGIGADPYLFNQGAHQLGLRMMQEAIYRMENDPWYLPHVTF